MSQYSIVEARDLAALQAARELATREASSHALLAALIDRRIAGLATTPRILLAQKSQSEPPVAMATFGPLVAVSAGPHRALQAIGRELAGRDSSTRMIDGAPESIEQLLVGYCERRVLPNIELEIIRDVMVMRRPAVMPADDDGMQMRCAELGDIELIATGHRDLVMTEFGYDPGKRTNYREQLVNQIQADRWWIVENDQPRLICERGSHGTHTMRLENIWSPPESRGHGYATKSLSALANHFFKEHQSVSVSVTSTNVPAIALYKRLGFVSTGQHRLLFFKREGADDAIQVFE